MDRHLRRSTLVVCPRIGNICRVPASDDRGHRCCQNSASNIREPRGSEKTPLLCGLCAEAVVPAPSRWAPLLCEPCREAAAAHNANAGYAVIPLGRHALANGPGPATPAGVVNTLGGLRAGIEALDSWRARRVRARLSESAGPTPVTTYLDAVDDDLDRCRLAEDFVLERSIRPHAE